jgi:hypothetical protein
VPLEHRVGVAGQGAGAPEEEGDDRERRDEDEGEVGPGWARPGTDPLDDEGHQRDGDQHDDDGIRGVGHRDEDHAHHDEHHGSSDRGPPPGAVTPCGASLPSCQPATKPSAPSRLRSCSQRPDESAAAW